MDPLIIAIVFSVIVVGGTYLLALRMSKSTVRNMNLRAKELAKALGLPLPQSDKPALSAFYSIELNGKVEKREFYFTNFTRSANRSASYTTEFSWALERNENHRVVISREGIAATFQKQFGMQDIRIGYKEFDDKFIVKCDNPDYVKKLLTDELMLNILKKERMLYGTIIIHHQEVHYEEPGVLVNKQDIQRMLRIIELCRQIAVETENITN